MGAGGLAIAKCLHKRISQRILETAGPLGATATTPKFRPTKFAREDAVTELARIADAPGANDKSRVSVQGRHRRGSVRQGTVLCEIKEAE